MPPLFHGHSLPRQDRSHCSAQVIQGQSPSEQAHRQRHSNSGCRAVRATDRKAQAKGAQRAHRLR